MHGSMLSFNVVNKTSKCSRLILQSIVTTSRMRCSNVTYSEFTQWLQQARSFNSTLQPSPPRLHLVVSYISERITETNGGSNILRWGSIFFRPNHPCPHPTPYPSKITWKWGEIVSDGEAYSLPKSTHTKMF